MFKEMRKKNREISNEQCIEVLEKCDDGVLSTICENGYPYGVTVNYIYKDNSIYFHCAKAGQKLDNILNNSKVCFSVADNITIRPDKFDTLYSSVVVFGNAYVVENNGKKDALIEIMRKYSPAFLESGMKYIDKAISATTVIKIDIDHMTGKSSTPNN